MDKRQLLTELFGFGKKRKNYYHRNMNIGKYFDEKLFMKPYNNLPSDLKKFAEMWPIYLKKAAEQNGDFKKSELKKVKPISSQEINRGVKDVLAEMLDEYERYNSLDELKIVNKYLMFPFMLNPLRENWKQSPMWYSIKNKKVIEYDFDGDGFNRSKFVDVRKFINEQYKLMNGDPSEYAWKYGCFNVVNAEQ